MGAVQVTLGMFCLGSPDQNQLTRRVPGEKSKGTLTAGGGIGRELDAF